MNRLLCLAAIAASIACQPAPSAPDTVAPPITKLNPFAGVWAGEYRVTSTQGGGHRPGTLVAFTLRLEQAGAELRGNFQTDSVLIDVSGTMDDDFFISLQGSAPGLGGPVDFVGAATLTKLHARIDPASGLAGELEYRLDRAAESPLGFSTVYKADIATAQRSAALLPSTFDGNWVGRFIVRECTGTCLPPHVNEIGGFRLTLQQQGSAVTGVIGFVASEPPLPVIGHVDGNRLVLDSSTTAGRFRIVEWSTERDRYGRMVGAFAYQQLYQELQLFSVIRRVQIGTASLMQ